MAVAENLLNPALSDGATHDQAAGLPDGLKVDIAGNLYCTGPGGIWIFSAEGRHLGTVATPEVPANCHWGEADADALYHRTHKSVPHPPEHHWRMPLRRMN